MVARWMQSIKGTQSCDVVDEISSAMQLFELPVSYRFDSIEERYVWMWVHLAALNARASLQNADDDDPFRSDVLFVIVARQ